MLLASWLRSVIRENLSSLNLRLKKTSGLKRRVFGGVVAAASQPLELRAMLTEDFGDAPDTGAGTSSGNYETLLANGGPRHTVVAGLRLGALVDVEANATQNATATGDDITTSDDEDGVVSPLTDLLLTTGTQPTITLRATNTTGTAATLYGWVDTNNNGVFDNATERASITVPNGSNNAVFTLTLPTLLGSFTGKTFARFRLSTDVAAANSTGAASDGEVEDYAVEITKPTTGTVKTGGITLIGSGTNGGPTLADRDQFGRSVAAIGDIDGDGVIDLVVGAHQDDTGADSAGAAYVLRMNADGTVKASTKIAHATGGGPTLVLADVFGTSVAGIGDIDRDGIPDIAVSAIGDDTVAARTGAVYLFRLNADGTVKTGGTTKLASGLNGVPTLAGGTQFGTSVAAIGDVDGDGVSDLAVGAYAQDSYRGGVYVLLMNPDGTVKSSSRIANGVGGGPTLASSDQFGTSVAPLGDIDGDGIVDLAVGAVGDDTGGNGRGAVYIVRLLADGTAKSLTKIADGLSGGPGLINHAQFGGSLAQAGDLDGNGVADLLVGSPDITGNPTEKVYVLFLKSDGTSAGATAIGNNLGGGPALGNVTFGRTVAALGDFDGDGVVDFAVGTPNEAIGGYSRGAIRILRLNAATFDYGDAPDTGAGTGTGNYATTLADGGPRHIVTTGLRLGASVDAEADATANAAANGDGLDEDGVLFPLTDLQFTIGAQSTVTLRATNTTGVAATLYGWVDYNANGVFDDTTERASVAVPTGTNNGSFTLTFPTVPAGFTGTTYARFRLSTDTSASSATGVAINGEVEDYAAAIVTPSNGKPKLNGVTKIGDNLNGGPSLGNQEQFGTAVVSLGDLDGDGIGDIAVGAQRSENPDFRGAVYIQFLNANGSVKATTRIGNGTGGGPTLNPDDFLGSALANLGDIDGDGVVDLAVGSAGFDGGGTFRGSVYILRLNTNGSVKSGGITRISDAFNGGPTLANFVRFGNSVANLGDVDGDGMIDLAVGAYSESTEGTSRGAVYVLRLNTDGTVKSGGITRIASGVNGGPTLGDRANFGHSVTSLGDFDGDGIGDLAVGALRDSAGAYRAGAVYILRLNADGTVKSGGITQITSGTNGGPTLLTRDYFGSAVANVGDLDGDGVSDLVVGAYGDDTGVSSAGALYVLRLNADGTVKTGGVTKLARNLNGGPTLAGDRFGSSVASLGDFDADGVADLIVGAVSDAGGGGSNRGAVHILRLDVPATPTALGLSANTIAENQPSGTAIGTFSSTDANPFDTFTYTLVSGTGDTDNGSFQIVGNALQSNAVFDFETKSSYSIRVRTTDDGGQFFERTLNVLITNINEAPTTVTLQNTTTSLAEDASTASAVKLADVVVTDDALGTNDVSLSGSDAAFFEVVSNELRLKAGTVLNFETKPSYSVTVNVNDTTVGAAPDASQSFALTITDVNEAPTVALQNTTTTLAENTSTVSAIKLADIVVTDDALGTNDLSLSGTDAAFFEIVGNELRLKSSTVLDFETKSSYSITVDVNDAAVGGAVDASANFTLTLTNVLDTTADADAFTFTFSTVDVVITHAINGGTPVSFGSFPLNSPIVLNGLAANDSVRVIGTSGPDLLAVSSAGLVVNGTTLTLSGPALKTLVGGAGNDVYQFDADNVLGAWSLDESGGGTDTVDFSPTTTVGLSMNMAFAGTQPVHATNLSLSLGSGATFENAIGGDGADSLTGNSLDNTLQGGAGNDRLIGAAGSDSLLGGADDDTYFFGAALIAEADQVTENLNEGTDTLSFIFLTTSVSLNLGDTSVQTVHTNRTLQLNSSNTFENASGGSGSDTLTGNTLNNALIGGAGDDALNGAQGSDLLSGGANNDTFSFDPSSSAEADQVTEDASDGIDTLSFASLTTDIVVNLGSNSIQPVHLNRTLRLNSGALFENVVGGSGADTLFGNSLNNSLTGGAGNDRLIGAAGNDLLLGGADNDTYFFGPAAAAEADQVTENPNEGSDMLNFGSLTTNVALNLGDNSVQTVHVNRTLGLNSSDTVENAMGGSGADSLIGNSLNNTLVGGAGDDTLNGALGNDLLFGGVNNDTYLFGPSSSAEADQLTEDVNDGIDTLSFASLTTDIVVNLGSNSIQPVHLNRTLRLNSGALFENVVGGSGADTLFGNSLNNSLTGGAGNDRLIGAAGNDLLLGGANDDTYFFGVASLAESDQVTENANEGIDTLNFANLTTDVVLNLGSALSQPVHVNRTLSLNSNSAFENAMGGTGNDTLLGNASANRLTGANGDDILVGLESGDILEGGIGRDILIGGPGPDVITGGAGEDILIAGQTTSDTNVSNLNTLRAAWVSTDSYEVRIASLRTGVGSPLVSLKTTIDVINDSGEGDALFGGGDSDWFFRALDDVITDLVTGEIVDVL